MHGSQLVFHVKSKQLQRKEVETIHGANVKSQKKKKKTKREERMEKMTHRILNAEG